MLRKSVDTLNRILVTLVICGVAVVGMIIPTNAQNHPGKQKREKQKQEKQKSRRDQKSDKHAAQKERNQQKQKERGAQQQQQAERRRQQQATDQQRRTQQRQSAQQEQNGRRQRPEAAQQQQEQRVSRQRRQQNGDQQRRLAQYRQRQRSQDRLSVQRSNLLQRQRRSAQYRFQQDYLERRRQLANTWNARSYDYNNDPNFYAPSNYRYSRGGRYYQTNQYGADSLRQAVNYGYEEGFQAGQADREDHWRNGSYQSSYAYQDANYGYNGYYVSQTEYSYYFREGFRRGYEDGYNSRSQYGSYSNGNYSILGAVLNTVLNLSSGN